MGDGGKAYRDDRAVFLRLRVCHAFPSDEPMSVAWRDMVLTSDEPVTSGVLWP